MKRLCTLLCFWCCGIFAHAQSQYAFTTNYQIVANDTNCVTFNCFLPTASEQGGGSIKLSDISSGFDGNVIGVDASGQIWALPVGNGTTQPQWFLTGYGTGATKAVQRYAYEVYRIASPYNGCTAPNGAVERYTNPWISEGICAEMMSISEDDALAIVKSQGRRVTC
jgi:hypothetical protein